MRKVVFFIDNGLNKEKVTAPDICKRMSFLKEYDAEMVVIDNADNPCYQFEDFGEFIMKVEKEGPEWQDYPDSVYKEVEDAEVIITHFGGISKKVIDAAKNLKLIVVLRSGIENVNVEAATERKIPVVNAPGRVAEPVADFTVAMILAQTRNVVTMSLNATGGKWLTAEDVYNGNYMENLKGKTVGLIGFGDIGRRVSARLKPFGVDILVYDPFIKPEVAEECGVTSVSQEELLKNADIVSMHARLLESTRKMFGKKQFDQMKPTAIFVNTARAGLVDEEALVEALQSKKILGAALDVFKTEPLPADHPLLSMDNVTLTPHIAGYVSNICYNSFDAAADDIERYFKGEAMRNVRNLK